MAVFRSDLWRLWTLFNSVSGDQLKDTQVLILHNTEKDYE